MKDRTNDTLSESLSALVDGEANELEVRRLLNQLDSDTELTEQWQRHQMLGALMRDEPMGNLDMTAAINAGIDADASSEHDSGQANGQIHPLANEAESGDSDSQQPNWMKSLASVSIAASVTLAVLIGVRSIDSGTGIDTGLAQTTPSLIESKGSNDDLQHAQQQLQDYVLEHAEGVGSELNTDDVSPYARVVKFEEANSSDATNSITATQEALPQEELQGVSQKVKPQSGKE